MELARKSLLICFTGMDGAGKTQQAKFLDSFLKEEGIKSQYVWARFEPKLIKPLAWLGKAIFFRGKDMVKDYGGYHDNKRRVLSSFPIAQVYQALMTFDYLLQVLFRVRLPLVMGNTVVCDRYYPDTLVDLAVDQNYSTGKLKSTLKLFSRLFPKPDLMFLIDLPEEVAFQRKDDIPSLEYLQERRRLYLDVARENGMVILDGSMSEAEVRDIVEREMGKVING